MNINGILNLSEDRKHEFKETLPGKNDLCKTVVAFANDAGGEIYIGIKDHPRKIVGVPEDDLLKLEERISNIIHDNCAPLILPDIYFLNLQRKHVVVIKIYKGNNPPYFLLKLIAEELKKYPEMKMQWSEPGMAFRTFKKSESNLLTEETDENRRKRMKTDENDPLRPVNF